jgi:hypothetical protein
MIGRYHECVDSKWMSLARAARRLTQHLDLLGQKTAATIEEIRREEPASAWDKRATIIGHIAKLTQRAQGQSTTRMRPSNGPPSSDQVLGLILLRRNKAIAPYPPTGLPLRVDARGKC